MNSIGEPAGISAPHYGERDPVSDPGLAAGSPIDDYDVRVDLWESVEEAYRVIRERMSAGGPGWEPKV